MNKYLSKLVKHILLNNEDCRDDWMLTIQKIHDAEMVLLSCSKEEYYETFFKCKLSNIDSITRLWRLLQEKHPELRGKTWLARQIQGGEISMLMAKEAYTQLEIFD